MALSSQFGVLCRRGREKKRLVRLNRDTKSLGFILKHNLRFGLVWLLSGCLLMGCGSDEWKPGDADNVRMVIADISDARANPQKLATLFAEDSVPDRTWLKKSAQWSFVVESVDADGDSATVEITVEDFFGSVVGTSTWTCERASEGWKIKDAPLP